MEEREIDAEGNVLSRAIQQHTSDYSDAASKSDQQPSTPMIRDSSRNRLQRLGTLYSDNENLSSPIHRNEARFDAAEIQEPTGNQRNPARSGKLAALASSINSWEDELNHPEPKTNQGTRQRSPTKRLAPTAPSTATINSNKPKIVGSSPNKNTQSNEKGAISKPKLKENSTTNGKKAEERLVSTKSIVRQADTAVKSPSKQLKWDKNVMDSLEAQGFTRRESTTSKMVYEYSANDKVDNKTQKPATVAPKVADPPKALASIGKGLVSGRAAIFETGNSSKSVSRVPQKDPAEMSLKDRLALFEKNKGTAIMPKAAFGMSASSTQISNVNSPKPRDELVQKTVNHRPATIIHTPAQQEKPKIDAYNKPGKQLRATF